MKIGLGASRRVLGLSLSMPVLGALVSCCSGQPRLESLDSIETIVVIYAENRSFDNLFGLFPEANGVPKDAAKQTDRDGEELGILPPIWGGLTAADAKKHVPEKDTTNLPNAPFRIDDPQGRFNIDYSVPTRDLVHRFYHNQMQINGGKNDRFVAWGDSGALGMGHYDGSSLRTWYLAKRCVLACKVFM